MESEFSNMFTQEIEDKIFEYGFKYINFIQNFLEERGNDLNEKHKKELEWEKCLFNSAVANRMGGRGKQRLTSHEGSKSSSTVFQFDLFDQDALDYFWARTRETSNPVLKAWYLNLIFEAIDKKKYQNNTDEVQMHKVAERLVQAYLDAYGIYPEDAQLARADSLWRAREIATRFNNDVLLQLTFNKAKGYIERCREVNDYRVDAGWY